MCDACPTFGQNKSKLILFDQSKKEIATLGKHFKELHKRLKSTWEIHVYGYI